MVARLALRWHGGRRRAAPRRWAQSGEFQCLAELEPGQRISCNARPDRRRALGSSRARPHGRRARVSETLEPALPKELDEQAEQVMRRLCEEKLCVATAESCTGGLLASLLTDIEGCGRGFDRGFVTYSGEAKKELLGLSADKVEENEAVNADVARAMAEGALKRSNAD